MMNAVCPNDYIDTSALNELIETLGIDIELERSIRQWSMRRYALGSLGQT